MMMVSTAKSGSICRETNVGSNSRREIHICDLKWDYILE
jgi:hypothetical protein